MKNILPKGTKIKPKTVKHYKRASDVPLYALSKGGKGLSKVGHKISKKVTAHSECVSITPTEAESLAILTWAGVSND